MKATKDQLHTLRHMLGINTPNDRVPKPYRNYAAVNPGDPVYVEMERAGWVRCYRKAGRDTEYDWYTCTDDGKRLAMESHATIRRGKAARVYGRFLDIRDSYQELTFKEFLTSDEYREARQTA